MALAKTKLNEVETKATPVLADSVLMSDSEDGGRGKLATLTALQTLIGVAFQPSGTDDTTAMQAAIDAGGIVQLGAGTYIVSSVDVSNDVIIQGVGNDTIIKRKDNTITTQNLEADRILFNIDTDGIRVVFRDLTIDENEANQNAYAAYGYAIGVDPSMAAIAIGINLAVTDCTIKNITNCGIALITGDNETVRSYLSVINCTFLDGRVGLAAGNENVISPSGFSGYYISCSSFTQSHIVGNRFRFTTPLNDAEFAPVAIWATSASNGSSGSEMLIEGNYFYGCGRGDWYNNLSVLQDPLNILGVIDIYNFGKRVRIVNNQFENNYAPAIRGKTNIDQAFVSGNIINDTFPNDGIIFGPSSLPEQAGNIIINNNQVYNSGTTGIGVSGQPTGHSTTKISSIVISGNKISGVAVVFPDNPSPATGIRCAYTDGVKIAGNEISDVDLVGIDIRYVCNDVIVNDNVISCGNHGISFTTSVTGVATISGNTITSGNFGAALYGDETNKILIIGNTIKSSNNYAFLVSKFDDVVVSDNVCGPVTGSAYFLRIQNCDNSIIVSGNTIPQSGVAPYYPHTGTAIAHIFGNSWNPRISYGTAAPASGTYKVGDTVYNTAPAPSGYTGWICTTAGTPGTWKGFGVIES